MEILWIALYVALFDIMRWNVWLVLGTHFIHRYIIRPKIPGMHEFIQTSDTLTFRHSFGVLCVGVILMLQQCGLWIQDCLWTIQKKASKLYFVKIIDRRLRNIEEMYQRIKQQYYVQVKTTVISTLVDQIHLLNNQTTCASTSSCTFIDADPLKTKKYDINSVFVRRSNH